jgi:hypothetical protein
MPVGCDFTDSTVAITGGMGGGEIEKTLHFGKNP